MTTFSIRSRLVGIAAVSVLLALGTALPAGAFNPQPDPPGRVFLVGRVTDACTSRGIRGAIVTLTPTTGESNPPDPDRTVIGGFYLVPGLHSGDYSIGVQADGYVSIGGGAVDGTVDVSHPVVHIVPGRVLQQLNISLAPPDPC